MSAPISNISTVYFPLSVIKIPPKFTTFLPYPNWSGKTPKSPFAKVREMTKGYLGHGVKMGEGWLLTAEMLEFIEMGVKNIVCAQPFGCLPNHIIAKGMIRKIKDNHPEANIVAVDYDPGASSVNQENRIRLMLENARMMANEY